MQDTKPNAAMARKPRYNLKAMVLLRRHSRLFEMSSENDNHVESKRRSKVTLQFFAEDGNNITDNGHY